MERKTTHGLMASVVARRGSSSGSGGLRSGRGVRVEEEEEGGEEGGGLVPEWSERGGGGGGGVTDDDDGGGGGDVTEDKAVLKLTARGTAREAHDRGGTLWLLPTQTNALVWRNAIACMRKWQASMLLLVAPILLVLIIAGIDYGVAKNLRNSNVISDIGSSNRFDDVRSAEPVPVRAIPLCSSSRFIAADGTGDESSSSESCITIAYSPSNDTLVDDIVNNVMAHNSPVIPAEQVRAFSSEAAVNEFLLANPRRVLAAVHFDVVYDDAENEPVEVVYSLQTNSTILWYKGQYENPNAYVQLPVQVAVEREIVARLTRDAAIASVGTAEAARPEVWSVSLSQFPHPPASYVPSIAGAIAPTFLLAAAMVGFVIQLSEIVEEKHSKLRKMLRFAGMTVRIPYSPPSCTTHAHEVSRA